MAQFFAFPRNYGKNRNRASTGSVLLPQIADNDYNTFTDTTGIRCFVDAVGDGSGNALGVSHIFFKTANVDAVTINASGGTAANDGGAVTLPARKTDDSMDEHDISIDGKQNFLHPIGTPGDAKRIDFVFSGTSVKIYQIMVLNQELVLDWRDRDNVIKFIKIDYDLLLSGEVRESAVGNKRYVRALGNPRDKWRVDYGFEFWRRSGGGRDQVADRLISFIREHKNCAIAPEYERYPDRVFPAVIPNSQIQLRYIAQYKGAGRRISLTVDEA